MSAEYLTETWRPIPDCAGYWASSGGRLRGRRGAVLRPSRHKRTGYLTVSISLDGVIRTRLVHRLVAAAFYGPCPNGLEVNHKDGNKINCQPENLEYVTKQRNRQHAYEVGLQVSQKGERVHNSKLTDDAVREMRRLAGSMTQREMARRFGVAQQTVSKAICGDKWRHVA